MLAREGRHREWEMESQTKRTHQTDRSDVLGRYDALIMRGTRFISVVRMIISRMCSTGVWEEEVEQ